MPDTYTDNTGTTLGALRVIPTNSIMENGTELQFRKVKTKGEAYKGLVKDIARRGIREPIQVRAMPDTPGYFGIVNGLHRWTAAKELGLTEIPAHVIDVNEDSLLEEALVLNYHRKNNAPTEEARAIRQMLSSNPALTKDDIANKLSVKTSFVDSRLRLLTLPDKVQEMINQKVLPLGNASALTRVVKYNPVDEWWDKFLIKAVELKQQDFNAEVEVQIQALKKQAQAGKTAKGDAVGEALRPRKVGDVKTQYRSLENEIKRQGLAEEETPEFMKGYFAALQWYFQTDAESIAERAAEKQRKEEEKARKRVEESQALFAKIQAAGAK